MNYSEIKNTRALKVTFLAPTNSRGARIKITDDYNRDKKESKVFSYCYKTGDVLQQAVNILLNNGFNIVCRSSMPDYYVLSVDNWGEDFKSIKDLK